MTRPPPSNGDAQGRSPDAMPPRPPAGRPARRRRVGRRAGAAIAVAVVALVAWLATPRAIDRDPQAMTVLSPAQSYDGPALDAYRAFYAAERSGDMAGMIRAAAGDGFLAYRAALAVARTPSVDPVLREASFRRVFDLRIDEPLARAELRELQLEYAALLEANGAPAAALATYRETLPAAEAVAAVQRLEPDPFRRANAFLQARMAREALDALGDRTAPSIEAPAHRRLDEHEAALDAYRRWLAEAPSSIEARSGLAWSHWYLGDLDAADAAFRELGGSNALYGRALIANRRGDVDRAVELLIETGVDTRWWLATTLLEREGQIDAAIDLYLRLATTPSAYADDAAFRALVLADRAGRVEAAARAKARLPDDSYFALRRGANAAPDVRSDLPAAQPEALGLAAALVWANDPDAAVGELQFALRDATDAGDVPAQVAIAEMLVSLGDYRSAQRVGSHLLDRGERDVRVWQLAYPRAYAGVVGVEARAAGVEPALVWSIMRQESAFFPTAVSRSNARGLMQVIPSTWSWLAELQDEPAGDPFDPATNIRYGVHYLGWLFDYFEGDAELVIPSYNRGQGYIGRLFEREDVAGDKRELFRAIDAFETREYLQKVGVNLAIYRALYGEDPVAQLRR